MSTLSYIGMKDYSLFFRFIEENLPNGFLNVKTESPLYLELENQCRQLDQSFHLSDVLQVRVLFVEKGLGPHLGLPYGLPASELSAESFYQASHPDYKMFFQAGFGKLVSTGYALSTQPEQFIIYSRIYPLKDIEGKYNYQLIQAYTFKSSVQRGKVYTLIVNTNINGLFNENEGVYCYLGHDVSQFRYPDADLMKPKFRLSLGERRILAYLSQAKTSAEIGKDLFLSKHTIDTHRRNILRKTGYATTASLIKDLTEKGLI